MSKVKYVYLEDAAVQDAMEQEFVVMAREAVKTVLQEIAREHGLDVRQAIYDEVKKQITKEHVEQLIAIVKRPVGGEPA